ncbi:MAG: aminotransferase class V-fold PLP-dependent enzyme [Phaeodactylibacter sp.]|nr:aminotransferase class V-fold PLP-dependent enzyme [Phaeodactylibacter sp.]MCB9273597.1 aminotransferase class V-fold PLP-dependent enzyme [Lewinellaceae bacterium]
MDRRKFIRKAALTAMGAPYATRLLAGMNAPLLPPMPEGAPFWEELKKQFPMPLDEAYFNSATLGAQPKVVLEKVIQHMQMIAASMAQTDYHGNGPLLLSGYEPYVELRKKIGLLINAGYKEIALTQNATVGMNYVATGLDLREGDEVINTNQEHGGGKGAWEQAAARYKLVYKQAVVPVPANDPQEIIDNIFNLVGPRTRVIAIPHIISAYGVVMPVKEACRRARELGIFTILDGAQAVGHVPVDVQDIGCDAYYSSLHKWMLAPAGNGILYVRNEEITKLWSAIASYEWQNQEDPGYRLTQRGTGNPSLVVGMEAAIDFHNEIGPEKVTGRIKYLGDYLRARLQEIKGVKIYSSVHPEMCAGITTYGIDGVSGIGMQKLMWERRKLQPRAMGDKMVRHSVHIYNLEREIDAALEIVRELAG